MHASRLSGYPSGCPHTYWPTRPSDRMHARLLALAPAWPHSRAHSTICSPERAPARAPSCLPIRILVWCDINMNDTAMRSIVQSFVFCSISQMHSLAVFTQFYTLHNPFKVLYNAWPCILHRLISCMASHAAMLLYH